MVKESQGVQIESHSSYNPSQTRGRHAVPFTKHHLLKANMGTQMEAGLRRRRERTPALQSTELKRLDLRGSLQPIRPQNHQQKLHLQSVPNIASLYQVNRFRLQFVHTGRNLQPQNRNLRRLQLIQQKIDVLPVQVKQHRMKHHPPNF